jgi:integrase
LSDYRVQEEDEEEQEENIDPYTLFVYGIRSPYTKESYFRRLRGFFDAINLDKNTTFEERCNMFAYKGRSNSKWAFNNIIRFLYYQKERVEKKEITAGTLHNYIKTLKMFCEVTDIVIPWKKITRGLPKGRMHADDRAPTLEEIHKIIEYPDRRIKPIVYTMASSGIRVGAWDYLKWNHVSPIVRDGKLVAAKINVYAGEDDEYVTFITPEAYLYLQSWINYRRGCGEHVTKDSWIMRDLWNAAKLPKKEERGKINEPIKLQSIGVKRLVERALWAQGVRSVLEGGKKRHEFQTDHGFRKWYKTQCEMAGMKSINIEKLMGHSLGMSTNSYYRATSDEILKDYLKAVPFLTISSENRLQKQMEDVMEQSKINSDSIKSQLYEKEQAISNLTERNSSNTDAIAALSDQILRLTKEINMLKKDRTKYTVQ